MLNFFNRTKVECAGLCLSVEECHAFEFKESNSKDGFNCTLYKEEGICEDRFSDLGLVEVYVDHSKVLANCQGQ